MEQIKNLEKVINKSKYIAFTRIEKGNNYYVYERRDTSEGTTSINYEVFKKVIKTVQGVLSTSPKYQGYTHYEAYPCDEDFGSWAWSCSNLERVEMIKNLKDLT